MDLGLILGTLYLAAGGLVCLLGVVIFRENPAQQLNRVAALMLSLGGVGAVLGATDFLVQGLSPAGTVFFGDLARNFAYLWEFFFPALMLFAATFPQPRSWLVRRRYLGPLLFVPHAFHFLLLLAVSVAGPDLGLPHLAKNLPVLARTIDLASLGLELAYRAHRSLFSLVNMTYALGATVLLLRSLRSAKSPRLRSQLRVICIGLASSLGLYVTAVSLPTIMHLDLPPAWGSSFLVLALMVGSGSIAYAIVRHRFLDTRLIARRSVVYGMVAVVLIVVYLALVKPIGAFGNRFTGTETPIFETIFVVIMLLLFQPLLGRLEDWVDRVLLETRHDHRRVLEELSHDVVTILDRHRLAERLLKALEEGLLTKRAVLMAADPVSGAFRVLARAGSVSNAEWEEASLASIASRIDPEKGGIIHPEEVLGLYEEGEEEEWGRSCEALLDTEILVPLRHREELVGLLVLGSKLTATRYTSEEIILLGTLGNQIAVALKNSALHAESLARAALEEELAVARQIQRTLLPTAFPPLGSFQAAGINIPSRQVGGDYYDLIPLEDGRFLFAIADVSGKGVPAALLMSMLQASLRTQAGEIRSVGEVVCRLNKLVYQSTPSERFATFFLGLADPRSLSITFTNAGHDHPIVRRATGETAFCERGGLPLGIMEDARYEEETYQLAVGDRLVLYTDGVTEARSPRDEEFGLPSLLAAIGEGAGDEQPAGTLDRVVARVMSFAQEGEPLDDLTLLVLRVNANGGEGSEESVEQQGPAGLDA